jgi:ribosomal subunit interface protein
MRVQIRGRGLSLTGDLRARVERHLGLALGRFADRIGSVTVQFSETDGHKRCQIDVGLRPRKVCVEEVHAESFAAFDHASARVSSSIARALDREQEWKQQASWPGPPNQPKT